MPLITEKISRSEITVGNYFEEVIPLSTGSQSCWGEVISHLDSRCFLCDFGFISLDIVGSSLSLLCSEVP